MLPLSVVGLLMGIVAYVLVCLVDLMIAQHLTKKWMYYPMIEVTCFCGWHYTFLSNGMWPNHLYRLRKIYKHTRGCLLYILNADFNGLIPYWAFSYAKDLKEYEESTIKSTYLTPAWYLSMAQKRSIRQRAGADPFDDTFETKDLDQLRREGYKV